MKSKLGVFLFGLSLLVAACGNTENAGDNKGDDAANKDKNIATAPEKD